MNGYAEPFKALLEVSRQNVGQSTEQTILLRQLVESLHDVEARHREASEHTRALVTSTGTGIKDAIIAEMRAGEGWWRKAVIIIGVITALNGAGNVARAIEMLVKH